MREKTYLYERYHHQIGYMSRYSPIIRRCLIERITTSLYELGSRVSYTATASIQWKTRAALTP